VPRDIVFAERFTEHEPDITEGRASRDLVKKARDTIGRARMTDLRFASTSIDSQHLAREKSKKIKKNLPHILDVRATPRSTAQL